LRPTFTFIPPALPSPAERVPIGGEWIHEMPHARLAPPSLCTSCFSLDGAPARYVPRLIFSRAAGPRPKPHYLYDPLRSGQAGNLEFLFRALAWNSSNSTFVSAPSRL
jgi:hypothetical protein